MRSLSPDRGSRCQTIISGKVGNYWTERCAGARRCLDSGGERFFSAHPLGHLLGVRCPNPLCNPRVHSLRSLVATSACCLSSVFLGRFADCWKDHPLLRLTSSIASGTGVGFWPKRQSWRGTETKPKE